MHDQFQSALRSENPLAAVQALLAAHPGLPALAGKHWAPGFGTNEIRQDVARLLIEHGAPLTVHAAAGLGFIDRIDPKQVHAKGGDGCTPLHFARNIETAQFLLDHGAAIDALDDDHASTPAQWRIGPAPELARFLLDKGAKPDIFLASALGDEALVKRLIDANPACVSERIGRTGGGSFPPLGHLGRGGTIYQWTLAFNSYPHQIALAKGHRQIFDLLYAHSDARTRLLVNCTLARRDEALAIAHQHPDLVASLEDADRQLLPLYCWETNLHIEAVRLMLDLGFPIGQIERNHGYTALHNAAWAGDAALVALLLERGAPVDPVDPRYNATALGYAIHDCLVEKRHPEGDFLTVIDLLLKAGCPDPASLYPTGNAAIDALFEANGR